MRSGIVLVAVLAAVLAGPGSMLPAAHAQTSFGKQATANPQNAAEWRTALSRELSRNLRAANTSLAVYGGGHGVSAQIAVTVARTGQVTGIGLVQGTGSANLDRALLRAMSRTKQVAPLMPDMQESSFTYVMQIGTTRG